MTIYKISNEKIATLKHISHNYPTGLYKIVQFSITDIWGKVLRQKWGLSQVSEDGRLLQTIIINDWTLEEWKEFCTGEREGEALP